MSAFFMFWVFVAAHLLSPVPVIAGVATAAVLLTPWKKAAGAPFAAALVAMGAIAYFQDPEGGLGNLVYAVSARLVAMLAWTTFMVALIMAARELFCSKQQFDWIARMRGVSKS